MIEKDQFIVGIIHARGGSKRIPLKNIKQLNGKPLIAYMIKAALGSKLLDRVIVSTDHPAIKDASLEAGAEVPFIRPPEISTDCASEMVSQHAVNYIENESGRKIDIVVSMQPTTPFCLSEDIDKCIELLLRNRQWGSTFSANLVMERPEWMFTIKTDGTGNLFLGGVLQGERGVMQSLPRMVIPNGGIYVTRRAELMDNDLVIARDTGIYVMPLERSVDIDEPIDFEFAEFLASKKGEDYG